jgi:hypothetical protein
MLVHSVSISYILLLLISDVLLALINWYPQENILFNKNIFNMF